MLKEKARKGQLHGFVLPKVQKAKSEPFGPEQLWACFNHFPIIACYPHFITGASVQRDATRGLPLSPAGALLC